MTIETNERIDRICECIGKSNTLNALHACRDGHPWNKNNNWCWRNAFWLVKQLDYTSYSDIPMEDREWLQHMATKEAGNLLVE
jgi:hypothetical protein